MSSITNIVLCSVGVLILPRVAPLSFALSIGSLGVHLGEQSIPVAPCFCEVRIENGTVIEARAAESEGSFLPSAGLVLTVEAIAGAIALWWHARRGAGEGEPEPSPGGASKLEGEGERVGAIPHRQRLLARASLARGHRLGEHRVLGDAHP